MNLNTIDKPRRFQSSNQTIESLMDLDLSLTITPAEMRRLADLQTTIGGNGSNANDTVNTTFGRSLFDLSTSQDLISTIHPASTSHNHQLCNQFLEILQSRTNDSEIFDTIQDLIQACSDSIDASAKSRRGAGAAAGTGAMIDSNGEQRDSMWLQQERNTWRLLYCLYKDRLIVQKEAIEMDDLPLIGSEKLIVEHLFGSNANLREYQLIVDWLELCALEQGNLYGGPYTDRTVCWENTLHQLQNLDQSVFGGRNEIVKSLDPDAPIRENRPLHDLDMEDEIRLSKQILRELRQGRFEEAQALCEHCGQPWRAALLEGWRLNHDPNFESTDPSMKESIDGNPRRDLWKKIAWQMADSKALDIYSRAIIGILCGHLDALLEPLGNSWTDLLWAYLKVQIDIRVESEIRSCSIRSYASEMPDRYWEQKMSLEQIFIELAAHKNPTVRFMAEHRTNVIQKFLILDDIPELMRTIDSWISETQLDTQMLRFLTHFVLFMRQVGRQHQDDIADKVIKSYAESLIELREIQAVAYYTGTVSNHLQIGLYSKLLQTLTETTDRKLALDEAMNVGLDVYAITCYTVEQVRTEQLSSAASATASNRQQQADTIGRPLQSAESDADLRKISILEWLTFYPQQRGELLWQANALIRTFLAETKLELIRKTFRMIPSDTIKQIMQMHGGDQMPRKEECSIKEYLCYQTYLAALDSYNDWTRLYHSRPKPPQQIATNANFTERIAAEHKAQSFESELERWKINLAEQTRITRDLLYNILLFPDKGYLIDPDTDENIPANANEKTEWKNRTVQLDSLRKLCIPEIVMLLHSVLHLAGDYKDCVRLTDVLAAEDRLLYTVFSAQKLSEIITKLAESSMALMNQKLDPWGFTSTC